MSPIVTKIKRKRGEVKTKKKLDPNALKRPASAKKAEQPEKDEQYYIASGFLANDPRPKKQGQQAQRAATCSLHRPPSKQPREQRSPNPAAGAPAAKRKKSNPPSTPLSRSSMSSRQSRSPKQRKVCAYTCQLKHPN